MNTHTSPRSSRLRRWLLLGSLAAGLVLPAAQPAFAVSEPSALTGEKQSYGASWEQEVQMGAEADKEITQQMGIYDDPKVQEYVQRVGQRVLAASTFTNPNTPEMYRNTKFTFRVLDSPVVNAFALPGGYVYVTRGLLAHADNEAQLAVVLGHEIAHVAARHSSQQARRSQWSQLGVIAGAILGQAVLGDRMPNLAENVLNMGGKAMGVFLLRYSREAEHEADALGVDYAVDAGYAAEESARFFDSLRRLSALEGKSIPNWLSSHPDPGNRADNVVGLARDRRNPAQPNRIVGTDEYLRVIDGMIVGEDPRQGFVQNGVFYHPTLRFQLPVAANWKVDNQPAAVVFAEPNGRALMGLRLAPATRTRDAAAQFTAENKVQVTASGDTVVNGLPATVVVGRAQTEQGIVGVWNAFIEHEGKVYSLLGYSPAQIFDQMRPSFESVAGGFGPLRDMRLASIQPTKLRIVRADRRAPFTTFVPTALPPSMTADQVAIMNQVALNENVPEGSPLKVPDATINSNRGPVLVTVPGQDGSPQSSTTYPGGYPSQGSTSTYPGTTTYPPPSTYPSQPSPSSTSTTYPQQYPSTGYPPQTAPTYPAQYPNQYPSQYPNQSGQSGQYPPQYPASTYPSSPYPASTYPSPGQSSQPYPQPGQSYPTSQYPQQQTYPSQQTYPQQGYPQQPSYPQSHPQQTYPSQTYPRSTPPQSQPTTSQPNWPRG